jgi:hypothetical protein
MSRFHLKTETESSLQNVVVLNSVMYKGLAWRIIVGSTFDDWIYWTLSITITVYYNSSHDKLLLNDVCLRNLSPLSESWRVSNSVSWSLLCQTLVLDVWMSEWTNFMRTEYRSPSRIVDCPLLFSVATKRVTISGQRADLYKHIRCRGNMFPLAVV